MKSDHLPTPALPGWPKNGKFILKAVIQGRTGTYLPPDRCRQVGKVRVDVGRGTKDLNQAGSLIVV
jgi:hypothetical protein